jgi:hypothetical protein
LRFDLSADRHAVGVFAQADHGQDHHQFPFTKMTTPVHFFKYTEEID